MTEVFVNRALEREWVVISHWPPRRICALWRTCSPHVLGAGQTLGMLGCERYLKEIVPRPPRRRQTGADSNIRRGSGRSRRGVVLHGRDLRRAGEAGCSGRCRTDAEVLPDHLPALTSKRLFASIRLSVQSTDSNSRMSQPTADLAMFPQYQLRA